MCYNGQSLFSSMIVVQLTGGLGNQLFQYSAGRHLAALNECPLLLDIEEIFSRSDPAHKRKYKLDHFRINSDIVNWSSLGYKTFHYNSINYTCRLPRFLGKIRGHRRLSTVSEPHFHFFPGFFENRGDIYLTTYWQSYRYFEEIKDIIRGDLQLKNSLEPSHQAAKNMILSEQLSVSLIVRRGDFANHPHHSKFHGCCSVDYYQRAINHIVSLIHNPHFFVFSDDIEWTRKNIPINFSHTYMDQSYDHTFFDYVDMHLISCCRNHIIANSTFGWWGAWLSPFSDKIIVAPNKWFQDSSIDTSDIIPSDWLRL